MKTKLLLLTTLGVLLVGSAIAQTNFTQKMTGNVPFDFVVNGNTFPKGEYAVSTASDHRTLIIQNTSKPRFETIVLSRDIPLGPDKVHSQSEMVFARTDGQHVLHQISIEGDSYTHDIIHGSDVIELAATR